MLKFINKNKKLTAAVCTVGILFTLGVGMTGCAPSFKRIANPSFFKEVSRVKYPSVESDFYVSVDGDDSASGSIDQPFATIKRAQEAVRVLSDTMFRSVIYDLLVAPEYQKKGIDSELVRRCLEHYPDSSWLVCTEGNTTYFYKKLGFEDVKETDAVLTIRNKWQGEK